MSFYYGCYNYSNPPMASCYSSSHSEAGLVPEWIAAIKMKWDYKLGPFRIGAALTKKIEELNDPEMKKEIAQLFVEIVDKDATYQEQIDLISALIGFPPERRAVLQKLLPGLKRHMPQLMALEKQVHEALKGLSNSEKHSVLEASLPFFKGCRGDLDETEEVIHILKNMMKIPEAQRKEVEAFLLGRKEELFLKTLEIIAKLPQEKRGRILKMARELHDPRSLRVSTRIDAFFAKLNQVGDLDRLETSFRRVAPFLETWERSSEAQLNKIDLLENIGLLSDDEWAGIADRARSWVDQHPKKKENALQICCMIAALGEKVSDLQIEQCVKIDRAFSTSCFLPFLFQHRSEKVLEILVHFHSLGYRDLDENVLRLSLLAEEMFLSEAAALALQISKGAPIPLDARAPLIVDAFKLLKILKTRSGPNDFSWLLDLVRKYQIRDKKAVEEIVQFIIAEEQRAWILAEFGPSSPFLECKSAFRSLSIENRVEYVNAEEGNLKAFKVLLSEIREKQLKPDVQRVIVQSGGIHALLDIQLTGNKQAGVSALEALIAFAEDQTAQAMMAKAGPQKGREEPKACKLITHIQLALLEAPIQRELKQQLANLQKEVDRIKNSEAYRQRDAGVADALRAFYKQMKEVRSRQKEVGETFADYRILCQTVFPGNRKAGPLITFLAKLAKTDRISEDKKLEFLRDLTLMLPRETQFNKAGQKFPEPMNDYKMRIGAHKKEWGDISRKHFYLLLVLQCGEEKKLNEPGATPSSVVDSVLWDRFGVDRPITAEQIGKAFQNDLYPNAFFIYAANMISLNNPEFLKSLGHFASAVCNGTFREERYSIEKSSHMEMIHRKSPSKWEAWKNLSLREEVTLIPTAEGPFNFTDWLQEKQDHGHLQIPGQSSLSDWIETKKPELQKPLETTWKRLEEAKESKEQIKLLQELKNLLASLPDCEFKRDVDGKLADLKRSYLDAGSWVAELERKGHMRVTGTALTIGEWVALERPDLFDSYEQALANFLQAGNKEEQIRSLKVLRDLLAPVPKECRFKGDIAAKLVDLEGRIIEAIVEIVDDPVEILLCGSWAKESCQRLDGLPRFNRGLLGYIWNGHNKLILITDKEENHLGRALLKLPVDLQEDPVLYLEKTYFGTACPLEHEDGCKEAIVHLGKRAAQEKMETDLVAKLDNYKDQVTDESWHWTLQYMDNSPCEYSDAMGKVQHGPYMLDARRGFNYLHCQIDPEKRREQAEGQSVNLWAML